jgi:hypothetical protein
MPDLNQTAKAEMLEPADQRRGLTGPLEPVGGTGATNRKDQRS